VEYNGNTQFFNRYVLGGGANVVGAFAVRVMDDYEMVDKVAADPYGIGFCSSAMADTSKVKILDITTSGGVAATFPNQNTKYRWVMPDSSAGTSWPLVRDIRVITGGDGSGAVSKFLTPASWMTFQNGPLFQASYWAS
jgi:ABC-type phosphate transport system substrate-binding protein